MLGFTDVLVGFCALSTLLLLLFQTYSKFPMLLGSHAVVACAILVLASMLLLAFLLLLTFLLFLKFLLLAIPLLLSSLLFL
jgi:hypothetical protein